MIYMAETASLVFADLIYRNDMMNASQCRPFLTR